MCSCLCSGSLLPVLSAFCTCRKAWSAKSAQTCEQEYGCSCLLMLSSGRLQLFLSPTLCVFSSLTCPSPSHASMGRGGMPPLHGSFAGAIPCDTVGPTRLKSLALPGLRLWALSWALSWPWSGVETIASFPLLSHTRAHTHTPTICLVLARSPIFCSLINCGFHRQSATRRTHAHLACTDSRSQLHLHPHHRHDQHPPCSLKPL